MRLLEHASAASANLEVLWSSIEFTTCRADQLNEQIEMKLNEGWR